MEVVRVHDAVLEADGLPVRNHHRRPSHHLRKETRVLALFRKVLGKN